ncbi:hypothetical protein BJX68DRAFT_242585 [Aspergillus pseudodeflectus]|uniref:Zn(2)-C6 fungal-type domain-containing protein n=1 Tax=Aspergillus pseudodeflectus TaxID=176178 RepID=A0ABR4JY10_9EURO
MGDSRRRQNHSCDPCRKGKRGCDAPEVREEIGYTCSNCKRWKKKCTFNFVSSRRADTRGVAGNARSKAKAASTSTSTSAAPTAIPASVATSVAAPPTPDSGDIPTMTMPSISSWNTLLDEGLRSSELDPASLGEMFAFTSPSNYAASALHAQAPNTVGGGNDAIAWDMGIPTEGWTTTMPHSEKSLSPLAPQLFVPQDNVSMNPYDVEIIQELDDGSSDDTSTDHIAKKRKFQWDLCVASDKAANRVGRSTMTRNLIRIYHDSMENALSCWLTEHNCPYADPMSALVPFNQRKEWGPSWSNRMCIRVCRLDRAASSIRGRALSAEEDKTAARALHLAIVAFASQWTQHAQRGMGLSVPADIAYDERSIRKNIWNEAKHALQHSTGIPSFRVIFANIIFSLTQSPLDETQPAKLGQLLENDGAPVFLENANRQLYTFRHKFARLQREAAPAVSDLRRGSISSTLTEVLEVPTPESQQLDPILASQDHRSTLSLLFWLGIMFDTLSAAMYQRPLVVSDEDSQIASASPSPSTDHRVNLNYWEVPDHNAPAKNDVWGDFFLNPPKRQEPIPLSTTHPHLQTQQPRWPCSYEEAASVLSEATPVKVLLYRRVTQLQTLIYRGASPARLEQVIQKTLLVYHHWTCTYQTFMLDCVANHESLPHRIQSWYVILDGHWHLAAMLLADVLESIDRSHLGLESERESRIANDLIATLRIDNALAVGALARSSLHGQNSTMHRYFHDSLNEVAFLVEPWTVVLIHSFAKAAYISLECLGTSAGGSDDGPQGALAECFRQNCEFCICALKYLGRKSDMASCVAGGLERELAAKVGGLG